MAHAQVLLAQLVHVFCIFHVLQLSSSLRAAFGSSQFKVGLGADAMAHCQIMLAQVVHILCIFHVLQLCDCFFRAFGSSQLQIGFTADAVSHTQILFSKHQAACNVFFFFSFGNSDFLIGNAGFFFEPCHNSIHIFSLVQHASEFIVNHFSGVQVFNTQVQVKIIQSEKCQNAINNNLCISRILRQLSNL